ncbi:MAG: AAA family ATPase, partial [Dehalococcoidia bacterium]
MIAKPDERIVAGVGSVALLERDHVLADLERSLEDAAGGRGQLVLIGAEAGGGKTALVQQFCQGRGRRARVLLGACDPLSTPRPLGPLIDLAPLVDRRLAHLIQDASQRAAVFHAFLEDASAGPLPSLIVFEDVHWADEATLDLLRFLGRRLASHRALLVVTYRDDELGPRHPLRIALGDLTSSQAVRRLTLLPLSIAAVGELARGSGLDPVVLHRQTGGNPFFVTEALAAGAFGIPPTVRDAVLARAARLSPAGRAALEAAAVIGARVGARLLAMVAADADAVDDCLAGGMLRIEDDALAFRHELVRQAILETLAPHRAAALHRQVLAALESRAE